MTLSRSGPSSEVCVVIGDTSTVRTRLVSPPLSESNDYFFIYVSNVVTSFSPTACYSEHRPLTSIRRAEDVLMLLSRPIFEPWCAGKADELKQMGAKRKVLLFLPFLLFFGAHGRLPHFVLPGTGTGS